MADLFNEGPALGEGAPEASFAAGMPEDAFWKDALRRVCPRAYDALCSAWMSGLPVDAHSARYARAVLDAAYKAGREIHRMKGLLRFSPAADGLYLARCAPEGFILPALAEHFSLRFGSAPWAVIDEKRNVILIRRSGETAKLEPLSPEFPSQAVSSDAWEIFWRTYFHSVTIENRKNPALQRQFLPERYRKYMTEFN